MTNMILTRAECERYTVIPGKTTVVMATCQSKIECLMWSIFSLLLRSSAALEHIIVSINGPDKRTGDPKLQDVKHSFLEELRNIRWRCKEHDRDMPLTVIRTWSRVGHSQATDMAIPWVHTEAYTMMHDDVIVNSPDWCEQVFDLMKDDVGLVYASPLLATGLSTVDFGDAKKINFPHPNSMFISSRKELYTGLGIRWYGYHIKKPVEHKNTVEFIEFHRPETTKLPEDGSYEYISMDFGTWPYYKMKKTGYKMIPLRENTVTHLTAMSWREEAGQNQTISYNKKVIDDLLREIYEYPDFKRLYFKYADFQT